MSKAKQEAAKAPAETPNVSSDIDPAKITNPGTKVKLPGGMSIRTN